MDYIKLVEDFHKVFQAPVLDNPQLPTDDRSQLRISLMQEDLDEIKDAIKNNDLVEVSDGLCDLMFVLCGSILEFGLGDKFNNLFSEVYRSNMSKSCSSMQEGIKTLSFYKQKDGTEGYYKEVNGRWIVYRTSDNKVLKSINYSKVNIRQFLDI